MCNFLKVSGGKTRLLVFVVILASATFFLAVQTNTSVVPDTLIAINSNNIDSCFKS